MGDATSGGRPYPSPVKPSQIFSASQACKAMHPAPDRLTQQSRKGCAFVSDDSGAASSGRGDSSAVFDLPEAARLLGVGRTLAYKLVRDGQWPTPVLRIGRLIKVPKKPLLDYLGADA
jgi:excisionase family DNA binding protein